MESFSIAIWLWNGVEELDFAGPFEVLTAWAYYAQEERTISVRTVAETTDPVTCAHGLRVIPDVAWEDAGHIDLFVHPGGDTRALQVNEAFLERIREVAASGTLMASVCTGALVFAHAGLLEGRRATTHWSAIEALSKSAVVDPEARFVDAGSVVTSAGVSAGIDMALHLIERLDSSERAQLVRRYIQYEPTVPV
jgi:transcriptional regulator GlxA family with amidase domain